MYVHIYTKAGFVCLRFLAHLLSQRQTDEVLGEQDLVFISLWDSLR